MAHAARLCYLMHICMTQLISTGQHVSPAHQCVTESTGITVCNGATQHNKTWAIKACSEQNLLQNSLKLAFGMMAHSR